MFSLFPGGGQAAPADLAGLAAVVSRFFDTGAC